MSALEDYLRRFGLLRLPWGAKFEDDQLFYSTTVRERAERAELGETAIRALEAFGASAEDLKELNALDTEDLKAAVEVLISDREAP